MIDLSDAHIYGGLVILAVGLGLIHVGIGVAAFGAGLVVLGAVYAIAAANEPESAPTEEGE